MPRRYTVQVALRRCCFLFLACLEILSVISAGEEIPKEAAFGSVGEDFPSDVAAAATSPPVMQQQKSRLQTVLAKKLLQKWGYMKTELYDGHWEIIDWRQESLKDDGTMVSSRYNNKNEEDNENSWSSMEKNKYSDGLRSFQRRFNLPVTGQLDTRTMQLMKQPRCAVPDNVIDDVIPDQFDSEAADDTLVLKKDDNNRKDAKGKMGKKTTPIASWQKIMPESKRKIKNTLLASKTTNAETGLPTSVETEHVNATPVLDTLTNQTLPNRTDDDVMEVITEKTDYSTQDASVSEIANDGEGLSLEEQPHRRRRNLASPPSFLSNILHRSKRTSSYVCNYGFTTNRAITWRILKKNAADGNSAPLSDSLAFTRTTLRSTVSDAFRRWAEVSQLTFKEQNSGSSSNVDIWIQFVSDGSATTPYGCSYYTGCFSGSEMAYSFHSGSRAYVYFRDDPNHPWSRHSTSSSTRDLLTVAVHEIGHILCLDHDYYDSQSVMYPVYTAPSSNFQVSIDSTARTDVKNLYGACSSPFVAFDWVRNENGVKKYSTYMFRGDHYWLWENSNKQTRYSDPRDMSGSSEWPGVPSNLQAIVQVMPRGSDLNLLYFFAGGRSYLYDQTAKRATNQGSISSVWKRKTGSSTDIPNNIKAAYYDKRDGNVYFFTSSLVYVYDRSSSNQGCCNSITSISSAFPGRYSSYPSLESNIDLAYYSISDRKLYFLKGSHYWESTYNQQHTSVYNRVYLKQYNWHKKWEYICEVD